MFTCDQLLLCVFNPGFDLSPRFCLLTSLPACCYPFLTLNLIVILHLSVWLLLNIACDLIPYCHWEDACVSKFKFTAQASWQLCHSAAHVVPVSTTRGAWTGLAQEATLIISGSTVWYMTRRLLPSCHRVVVFLYNVNRGRDPSVLKRCRRLELCIQGQWDTEDRVG